MGLEQRPYIGSWKLGAQKVVQMTPDALVYINGDLSLPGCPRCNGKINFQQYITEVSADAGTDVGGSSAGFTLSIPVHANESFARDAQYIIRLGLEVHIYERGYFAVKGLYSNLDQPQTNKDYTFSGQTQKTSKTAEPYTKKEETGLTRQEIKDWAAQLGVSEEVLLATIVINSESGVLAEQKLIADTIFNRAAKKGWSVWRVVVGEADTTGAQGGTRPYASSRIPSGDALNNRLGIVTGVLESRGTTGDSHKSVHMFYHNATQEALYQKGKASKSANAVQKEWEARATYLPGLGGTDVNRVRFFGYPGNPLTKSTVKLQAIDFLEPEVKSPEQKSIQTPDEADGTPSQDASSLLQQAGVQGLGLENILAYPYYLVFHGVITSVSVGYSGGVQTVTVQCASMLHFWEYQRISTQASLFGARPPQSGNRMTFAGHNLTGMHPYEIVYKMHQDIAGAAAGVSWALSQKSNVDAKSSVLNESLYSLNLRYWEKRFQGRQVRLRMHGIDGKLFNAAQAAYLATTSTDTITQNIKNRFANKGKFSDNLNVLSNSTARAMSNEKVAESMVQTARGIGKKTDFEINMADMMAYIPDLGTMGQISLFESSYESKLDIINTVCAVTGFEFYQDVDGDFVFKPPFYNLDTSSSRVYCLEDIDIISMSFNETEPQATYITAKNGYFGNITGHGVENEWGVQGTYIDYRLVAQFGWRPADFETNYLNDSKAIFFASANRLDILNIGCHAASVTIPLRPELRPGYPLYIRSMDCFYYCNSFAHSFSVGGQCTTTLELCARRAKFYAPGDPTKTGIEAIDLGNTLLPQRPLEVLDGSGVPRLSGFPNVVMALDPLKINPMFFLVGSNISAIDSEETLNALLQIAVDLKIVTRDIEADPTGNTYYWYQTETERTTFYFSPHKMYSDVGGKKTPKGMIDLRAAAKSMASLGTRKDVEVKVDVKATSPGQKIGQAVTGKAPQETKTVTKVVTMEGLSQADQRAVEFIQSLIQTIGVNYIQGQTDSGDAITDLNSTASLLTLLSDRKAIYTTTSLPGTYRYFSASHPDPVQQGQAEVSLDIRERLNAKSVQLTNPYLESKYKLTKISQYAPNLQKTFPSGTVEPEAQLVEGVPERGIRVYTGNPEAPDGEILPTSEIMELMFSKQLVTSKNSGKSSISLIDGNDDSSLKEKWESDATATLPDAFSGGETAQSLFQKWYADATDEVNKAVLAARVRENQLFPGTSSKIPDFPFPEFPEFLFLRGVGVSTSKPIGNGSYKLLDVSSSASAPELFPGSGSYPAQTVWVKLGEQLGRQTCLQVYANTGDIWEPAIKAAYGQEYYGQVKEIVSEFYGTLSEPNADKEQAKGVVLQATRGISTPVFPVSDARGYEVIGSFRYGRGVDIDPDGVFDVLHKQDIFQMLDKKTIDTIIRVVIKGESLVVPGEPDSNGKYSKPRKLIGSEAVSYVEKEVIRQLRNQLTDQQILDWGPAINKGTDPNSLEVNLANWFAEKAKDGVQKLPLNNAAYSLADLSIHTDQNVCACKMAEADVLLEAAGQDTFVEFAAPGVLLPTGMAPENQDRPTQWAISTAAQSAVGWSLNQDALRGVRQDQSNSSIVQAALGLSGDEMSRRADELKARGQGLTQMAAGVTQMGEDVAAEFRSAFQDREEP